MSLEAQRVALVTGATSGIGLAVSRALAAQGHKVFICARSAENVATTVKELRDEDLEVYGAACDVRSADDISAFVQAAVDRFGPIDVLVNNAGRSGGGVTADIDDDLWLDVVNTNLNSVFRMTREVLNAGGMRSQGSRPHHQHRLDRRQAGRRAGRPVLGVQARRRRLHQGPRQRAGADRHHRQRGLPRLRRDPDGPARPRRATPRPGRPPRRRSSRSSRRRSRSAATPPPRRSPAWSATWPPTPPPRSPRRRSTSAAAWATSKAAATPLFDRRRSMSQPGTARSSTRSR